MFVFNPAWPHLVGNFSIALACIFGVTRFLLSGWSDPLHCSALLNRGSWLDSGHKNWQPDGCMLHKYKDKEASACFRSKELIFIGDSVTRKLFFQVAQLLDRSLPSVPPDNAGKHADHRFHTTSGTDLTFAWDPFLNTSYTQSVLLQTRDNNTSKPLSSPAMLVLGSGLWYLRYSDSSGGIRSWESRIDHIFHSLATNPKPADQVVILPVEHIIPSKLTKERASTMHPPDIDAMNSDLYHRINPPSEHFKYSFSSPSRPIAASLPLVFNQMVDESLTEDGLHYSDTVIKIQANILLNLQCNDKLPKTFPFNKTCCNRYPWPSVLHLLVLGLVVLSGPWLIYRTVILDQGRLSAVLAGQRTLATVIISGSIALIYIADRTGFWLKEQKQFEPWVFGCLCLASLAVGLATVKRADKDLGFLNRDQTDEWKGWMQIIILIYHYCGASSISGIYNPVRVLVASYLFMTGYGHASFYIRKADFSFLRVAQVLIRLNLFTILLAYTMNTDYISYYFTPLVSMWYIVIYFTMAVGAQFNDRMLSAIAVIKVREYRLTDHLHWHMVVKTSIGLSAASIVWFFAFELYQESKFTYNVWHPYISFLPILAFVILRNSNPILRSATSRAFAFIGKCSLETFIIQFHFWLAGDTKGILLVIPGTRWRPINFIVTTVMFIYLSDRVAYAVTQITNFICGGSSPARALPLPVTAPAPIADSQEVSIQMSPLPSLKDDVAANPLLEPDTPGRPRRWVDRLADGTSSPQRGWTLGLKTKILLFMSTLWLLNMLWPYPQDSIA
ncbi:O-acetyltransferase [Phlegmacium glaucopus]|nr:O-acetyltransferase [Phlegmacium glaucopus]